MKKFSDLVSLDLILATIQKLSDKYSELENVADAQLQSEYSRSWYAEYHAAKNKQQVLNELYRKIKNAVEKRREALIPNRKRAQYKQYYVVKYRDTIVAIVNPKAVKCIDVSGSQENCVALACPIYYEEYGELSRYNVNIYGSYIKLCDVDINNITDIMPNTLIWDEIPVVDNFDQASDIHSEVMEAWFNIRRQYNK
jgi:hypothetical protein